MDPDYFSVTHMMKTFTKELKYNDICELWCTMGEEGLETGLCRLHSNEDVLQIIKRFERTLSDDLHVYAVHSKDGSNYFNTVQCSSKGAGKGCKGAAVQYTLNFVRMDLNRGTEAASASSTAGTSRTRASPNTNTNAVINEHETGTKTSANVASSSGQRPSTQPIASRVRSRAPPQQPTAPNRQPGPQAASLPRRSPRKNKGGQHNDF
ncbi:hypothetical protein CJ030_MR0G003704 [Morella rubra]|uniref:Uncharacterized protein n=1 Tax=Morella rubra TaxID=262757 RepID=A0A6A1UMG1_9ROSI|nr:hypothetical protein CJ030_MR0G003704 [Morella rubra]